MTTTAETSWNSADDTSLGADVFHLPTVEPGTDDFNFFGNGNDDDGTVYDAEFADEPAPSRIKSDYVAPPDDAPKTGMPSVDEWMHFFGNVMIRVATDWYIEWAFRDIDEEELSDREIERIRLGADERARLARPIAEYSYKSKFMRKHGRSIVSSAESVDSLIQFGLWFSRVNKIRARHKPGTPRQARSGPMRATPVFRPTAPPPQPAETDNNDVSSGSSPAPRGDHYRPDIAGVVFNPTGGG